VSTERKVRGFDRKVGFLDHLEELRWHLIRSAIAVAVGMIGIAFFVSEFTQYVILGPLRPQFPTNRFICELDPSLCVTNLTVELQAISPTEQFTRAILVMVVGGLVIAFPYIAWEFWRFLRPGLKFRELKATRGAVWIISALFLVGVAFAYFIMAPFALSFFANFQLIDGVENNWRIGKVIGLVTQLALAGGLLFEMPILASVLARIGVLKPQWLRKRRRHSIVVILILAGILTPTPDLLSQLLLAGPMYLLFEISIGIVARIHKRKEAERMVREESLPQNGHTQEALPAPEPELAPEPGSND